MELRSFRSWCAACSEHCFVTASCMSSWFSEAQRSLLSCCLDWTRRFFRGIGFRSGSLYSQTLGLIVRSLVWQFAKALLTSGRIVCQHSCLPLQMLLLLLQTVVSMLVLVCCVFMFAFVSLAMLSCWSHACWLLFIFCSLSVSWCFLGLISCSNCECVYLWSKSLCYGQFSHVVIVVFHCVRPCHCDGMSSIDLLRFLGLWLRLPSMLQPFLPSGFKRLHDNVEIKILWTVFLFLAATLCLWQPGIGQSNTSSQRSLYHCIQHHPRWLARW